MATVVKPRRVQVTNKRTVDGPLSANEISLVRETFKPVAEVSDKAAEMFYGRLFELDPSLKALFANADMAEQGKKLMSTIAVAVGSLDKLGDVVPTVQKLGVGHVGYGVKAEHYDTVGKALLETLKKALGETLTPEAEAAWAKTYGVLADTMKKAAADAASNAAAPQAAAESAPTTKAEESKAVQDAGSDNSRAILDAISASQALIQFQPDGTIITANQNFLDTMGYALSEIEGKHHSMFAPPGVAETPEYAAFWETLRANKFQSGQYPRAAKGGREIWLQASYNPVVDASGKVVMVVKNCVEITEQKLAADAAAQEAARQSQMIDQMPVAVMMCDLENFEVNYLNSTSKSTLKEIEHLLPVKADEMLGTCIDVFHKVPSHQRNMLSNPDNLPHSTHIQVGPETLDLLVTPIFGTEGEYLGPMLTWSVITDKLKAEADQDRQSQMLDQMPINVMMCDLENFEVTYANQTSLDTLKSIEHLLPIKADELVGTCIDIFHKNPSHQRNLLADKNNLPWKTKIQVGPETLDLNVSAITDQEGNYLAPMLSWSVVTKNVQLADNFETNIKGIVEAVSAASTEMQSSAEALAATAEETSNQANTVAAASEELSSSITEISSQVSRSASISAEAVTEAQRSENQIQGLAQAADKIGEVVNLINDIAGQTNLLALNATIEAARAGEAGKGFAVVASEVKSLANQTAKATDEISGQINSIQSATRDAVEAISGISKIINEINEIATAISSAVEEQGAATQEVATNIAGVTSAASETGQSASQVLEAAGELSKQSETLGSESDGFLTEMRAI